MNSDGQMYFGSDTEIPQEDRDRLTGAERQLRLRRILEEGLEPHDLKEIYRQLRERND